MRIRDEAAIQTLEATLIALILVASVSFVITFSTPSSPSEPARQRIEDSLADAIGVLYESPTYAPGYGDSVLSRAVAHCMLGDCTELETRVGSMLPPGTRYNVWLSNGYADYPVYVPDRPRGESVATSRPLEPKWSYTFLGLDFAYTSDTTGEPLTVFALPIQNSNVASEGGIPVGVRIQGLRSDSGTNVTFTAFTTTMQSTPDDAGRTQSVSLSFLDDLDDDGVDEPAGYVDVSSEVGGGLSEITAIPFTLRMEVADGAAPVPAGARIRVDLPRDWSGSVDRDLNDPAVWDFDSFTDASDHNATATGSHLEAVLLDRIGPGESRDFHFLGRIHGAAKQFHLFSATFGDSHHVRAEAAVRSHVLPGGGLIDYPFVAVTAPKAMSAKVDQPWSVALVLDFPDPAGRAQLIGVEVSQVEIFTTPGVDVFDGDVEEGENAGLDYEWTKTGASLVWKAPPGESVRVDRDNPFHLTFRAKGSGTETHVDGRTSHVVPIHFDGYTGRLAHQFSGGFYTGEIFPATAVGRPGYETAPGTHEFTTDPVFRVLPLQGRDEYAIGPVPTYRDAATGGRFSPSQSIVPLGDQVILDAEVSSLVFRLNELNRPAKSVMRLYPPFAVDRKVPIWENDSVESSIIGSDITAMLVRDVNRDDVDDVIIGTSGGRVLAMDGKNGLKLPSLQFDVRSVKDAVASVTELRLATLDGREMIVVGTDHNSVHVHAIDLLFKEYYRWEKPARLDVLGLDARVDMNRDGITDVLVLLSDGSVYALSGKFHSDGFFRLIPPLDDPTRAHHYKAPANPGGALVGLDVMGPWRQAGFAAGLQSVPSGGTTIDLDPGNPMRAAALTGVVNLPRHGMQGINENGTVVWTLYGLPTSSLIPHDVDDDGVRDVVAGSPAGYVIAADGSQAVQPIYSIVESNYRRISDSFALDQNRVYFLTDADQFGYTDDAFMTILCACDPATGAPLSIAGANAVAASPDEKHVWIVGEANKAWTGTLDPLTSTFTFTPVSWGLTDTVERCTVRSGGSCHAYTTSPFAELRDLNDVHYRSIGPAPDDWEGYIVGARCTAPVEECEKPTALWKRGPDASWRYVPLEGVGASKVTEDLLKVEFTPDGSGWFLGRKGTLLRMETLPRLPSDPPTFRAVNVPGSLGPGLPDPTSLELVDISCAGTYPQTACWVVATDVVPGGPVKPSHSVVFRLDNPHSMTPHWTVSYDSADPATPHVVTSVGFVSPTLGYLGAANAVLATWSGGEHWTKVPMNYVESDGRSLEVWPDGHGYVLGGVDAAARIFALRDFRNTSKAESTEFWDLEEHLRERGESCTAVCRIVRVDLEVDETNIQNTTTPGTWAQYHIGASDGGAMSWRPFEFQSAANLFAPWNKYRQISLTSGSPVTELSWRANLNVSHELSMFSPQIRELRFSITYENDGERTTVTHVEDFRSDSTKSPATTADWNTTMGVLRAPFTTEHWVQNVNGEVLDMALGDVSGRNGNPDGVPDVVAGTGDVLAMNDPTFIPYAGSDPQRAMSSDDRVYVLDGSRNGTPLWVSETLPGDVKAVLVADMPASSNGKAVVVATWNPDTLVGSVIALDGRDGSRIWTDDAPLDQEPVDLVTGEDPDTGEARPVAGTKGPAPRPGFAYAFDPANGELVWRGVPDERGRYRVPLDIPMLLPLGPYVMEFELTWTEKITTEVGGVPVATEVVQAARFYNYFTVTPPNGQMPISPIYTVKIVAWMGEWDYSTTDRPSAVPGSGATTPSGSGPGISTSPPSTPRYNTCKVVCIGDDPNWGFPK